METNERFCFEYIDWQITIVSTFVFFQPKDRHFYIADDVFYFKIFEQINVDIVPFHMMCITINHMTLILLHQMYVRIHNMLHMFNKSSMWNIICFYINSTFIALYGKYSIINSSYKYLL
jgi:hypothetical protein